MSSPPDSSHLPTSCWRARSRRPGSLVPAAACFLLASAAPACCAVEGTPEQVRLAAHGERLETLLGELRDKFGLVYQSAIPLDQTVDGAFSGELSSVVRSLLRQYDYVTKRDHARLEVTILTKSGRSAEAGAPTASPPPAGTPQPHATQAHATPARADSGEPAGAAPVTPLELDVRRRPVSISSYMQSQADLFTRKPAENLGSAEAGNARPGVPAVSQSTIADLTQRASATLRGLTAALARVGR